MLTRLKVSGFKNLVDVDVSLGPFTCIAGTNGIGKSNLFDAIRFLGALADMSLKDAAQVVRGGKTADAVRSLFHRVGNEYDPQMSFEAEMLIPEFGFDNLGQRADASARFLKYTLVLALRTDPSRLSQDDLEIVKEELVHITKGEASRHLLFAHSREWQDSALGERASTPFISTESDAARRAIIQLHQNRSGERSGGGRPIRLLASTLLRTMLSVANAAEHRTAVVARTEMRSWRLLQLEPSALREPDEFTASPHLGFDGSHLAATIYRLARLHKSADGEPDEAALYAKVSNRLAELIDDVRDVRIDRDERRELLTLEVEGKDHTIHPARALSDGTLRFLALAAIDLDSDAQGVLCLEEPENGIHPARIPAILRLLQGIATDPEAAVGEDNPLSQVIINTHSPVIVQEVPEDSILVADAVQDVVGEVVYRKVRFGCLMGTWRAEKANTSSIPIGRLIAYLNAPNSNEETLLAEKAVPSDNVPQNGNGKGNKRPVRVRDRADVKQLEFGFYQKLASAVAD